MFSYRVSTKPCQTPGQKSIKANKQLKFKKIKYEKKKDYYLDQLKKSVESTC